MKRFTAALFFFLLILFPLGSGHLFAQSIQELESKLKAARDAGDLNAEAEALVNLGDGYDASQNQKKAVENYKEAIKIYDKYNEPAGSAVIWNKIADSYKGTQKYSEAIDANTKALDLFKKANDKKGMANMNIELGDIYYKQQKFEGSLAYYKQALKMAEDTRDANKQVAILSRISESYNRWGNYDEAYKSLNSALEVAKKNNLASLANSISQNMDKIKKNQTGSKQSKTEFEHQKEKETQQQITVLSTEKIKSMAEIEQLSVEAQNKELKIKGQQEELLRKKLETEKKDKVIELGKKEQELSDAKLNQQQWIIWGGIAFSVLGLVLTFYIFLAYRNKKKANNILTQKNDIIYKQKEQIEQKNVLITDSIDYAKNIQDAILPPVSSITKFFPESFVLYKPKDIVSGDFFWTHEINNSIFIAAADCTGHGVPGAFMSLLGFIMLDDIVKTIENASPAEILNEVNSQLMTTLHQDGQHTTGKFGMDIALIKYNTLTKELAFSGAHNPLIIINNSEVSELKADRISIGTTKSTAFTNQKIQTKEGDVIYLYSDGYQDQIGGEKRKKYLAFHMKELFVQIHSKHMEEQKEDLDKKHMEWRSKTDQTDDILIIGLKV